MSYRSDLDAALSRIDALELDNARLVAENGALRAMDPSERNVRALAVVLLIGFLATFVVVAVMLARSSEDYREDVYLEYQSAERELGDAMAPIRAYYVGREPDALLWEPYDRAVTRRNAMLERWVHLH